MIPVVYKKINGLCLLFISEVMYLTLHQTCQAGLVKHNGSHGASLAADLHSGEILSTLSLLSHHYYTCNH